MQTLRFEVSVTIDSYNRTLGEAAITKEWERVAKRIARAAKGRSKLRSSQVWAHKIGPVCCGCPITD